MPIIRVIAWKMSHMMQRQSRLRPEQSRGCDNVQREAAVREPSDTIGDRAQCIHTDSVAADDRVGSRRSKFLDCGTQCKASDIAYTVALDQMNNEGEGVRCEAVHQKPNAYMLETFHACQQQIHRCRDNSGDQHLVTQAQSLIRGHSVSRTLDASNIDDKVTKHMYIHCVHCTVHSFFPCVVQPRTPYQEVIRLWCDSQRFVSRELHMLVKR